MKDPSSSKMKRQTMFSFQQRSFRTMVSPEQKVKVFAPPVEFVWI